MITFLRSDAKTELLRRDPTLADMDSTKWSAKVLVALKVALAEYQSNLIQTNDPWIRKSTLGGTAPVTGSSIITTTIGDVFQIAEAADSIGVADNTIWVEIQSSGTYKEAPRLNIDSIIVGGAGETIIAFHEEKGIIILYIKDGTFTPPARVHYEYYRGLVPTAIDADTLDIKPEDFSSFIDSVAAIIATA